MAPSFHFTMTPPGSPSAANAAAAPPLTNTPLLAYSIPQFFTRTTIDTTASTLDMQRRIDTIQTMPMPPLVSPALLSERHSTSSIAFDYDYDDDDDNDPSWSTPAHYYDHNDRAAAIAHKLAQDELSLITPAAVMLTLGCGAISTPFDYERELKTVRFAGLYVVNGPTATRHVRYAMEVAAPELQLRTRCIERFQHFRDLRKRLRKTTKRCGFAQHQPEVVRASAELAVSKRAALRELPQALRSSRCRMCRSVHKTLCAFDFPRRTLFTATALDVRTRSIMLEAFLGACVRLLIEWPGCDRGRKLFAVVLGKFLGVNILQQLYPSRYGRGSSYDAVAHGYDNVDMRSGIGESSAMSVGTTGHSSESSSSSSYAASYFTTGAPPSQRTLLSMRSSSSSSLSLHDEDEDEDDYRAAL